MAKIYVKICGKLFYRMIFLIRNQPTARSIYLNIGASCCLLSPSISQCHLSHIVNVWPAITKSSYQSRKILAFGVDADTICQRISHSHPAHWLNLLHSRNLLWSTEGLCWSKLVLCPRTSDQPCHQHMQASFGWAPDMWTIQPVQDCLHRRNCTASMRALQARTCL